MIQETIHQIEQRLESAENISAEKRADLLQLLNTLKNEVSELSKTHEDDAQSIAAFAQISTHEATRRESKPVALQHSIAGLESSVAGFEETHPRLVQVVNSICTMLSNLGI